MSDSLVITEKTTQVALVRAAVGDRYGEILPCSGHLLELMQPEELPADEWDFDPKQWSQNLLRPRSGLYPLRPVASTYGNPRAKLAAIRDALKSVQRVIISTDPDREGQAIGDELLEFLGYRGEVFRVIWVATDPASIRAAFEAMRPNREYLNLGRAARARAQADQGFNFTMTRAATTGLAKAKQVIGIGRVKTPTLGILAQREREIANFKPRDYFVLSVLVGPERARVLWLSHVPPAGQESPMMTEAQALVLGKAVAGQTGKLSVVRQEKREAPPKLPSLSTFQSMAGARFGWTATQVLEVAQGLYEMGLTTYPRSSVCYLPETMMGEAPALAARLAAQFDYAWTGEPVLRKGKAGHFWDAGLEGESHFAIIPNPAGDFSRLDSLAPPLAAGFRLLADRFLCALLPDRRYEQVVVSTILGGQTFAADFITTTDPGWRRIAKLPDDRPPPALTDGESAQVFDQRTDKKTTRPPPRYTDPSLIDRMENAWKLVPEGALRDLLKAAKGIGTSATRDSILEGLISQGLCRRGAAQGGAGAEDGGKGKKGKDNVWFVTPAGMEVVVALESIAPELLDPVLTAKWEMDFDKIVKGETDWREVIDSVYRHAEGLLTNFRAKAPVRPRENAPTEKMLALVAKIAAAKHIPVPAEVRKDFAAAKAFLDAHATGGPLPPSEKQLALARKLAQQHGVKLEGALLADGKALSAWIDGKMSKSGTKK